MPTQEQTATPTRFPYRRDPSSEKRETLSDDLYRRYGRSKSSRVGPAKGLREAWKWRAATTAVALVKRSLDLAVSASALVALAPLLAAVALLIHWGDGGPVFFVQTRVGRWGKKIRIAKFRSMVVNAETLKASLKTENHHQTGFTFKSRRDPRVTAIGRLIRKSSIDEMPQLWSVFKGDLTLVGPRPALPSEVERYSLEDRLRLEVKPGLTCLWQVSGRGDLAFDRQWILDMEYIHHQSLWLDLIILLKTIPAVLSGKGAY